MFAALGGVWGERYRKIKEAFPNRPVCCALTRFVTMHKTGADMNAVMGQTETSREGLILTRELSVV